MKRNKLGRFIKKNINMELVKNLYDEGKTLKQVGKVIGVDAVCIFNRLKEINYSMRKNGWHLPERQKGLAIRKKMSETRKNLFKEGKLDLSGKNNPAYINGEYCSGKKPSRKGWKKVRREVLKRDNYTCQKCGKTKKEIRIDVHHKIPYRICKEHKVENCVSLCIKCHGKISGNGNKS